MTRRDAPPTEADNAIDRLVADGIIERVDDCVRDEMKEKDDSVHFSKNVSFRQWMTIRSCRILTLQLKN